MFDGLLWEIPLNCFGKQPLSSTLRGINHLTTKFTTIYLNFVFLNSPNSNQNGKGADGPVNHEGSMSCSIILLEQWDDKTGLVNEKH